MIFFLKSFDKSSFHYDIGLYIACVFLIMNSIDIELYFLVVSSIISLHVSCQMWTDALKEQFSNKISWQKEIEENYLNMEEHFYNWSWGCKVKIKNDKTFVEMKGKDSSNLHSFLWIEFWGTKCFFKFCFLKIDCLLWVENWICSLKSSPITQVSMWIKWLFVFFNSKFALNNTQVMQSFKLQMPRENESTNRRVALSLIILKIYTFMLLKFLHTWLKTFSDIIILLTSRLSEKHFQKYITFSAVTVLLALKICENR